MKRRCWEKLLSKWRDRRKAGQNDAIGKWTKQFNRKRNGVGGGRVVQEELIKKRRSEGAKNRFIIHPCQKRSGDWGQGGVRVVGRVAGRLNRSRYYIG